MGEDNSMMQWEKILSVKRLGLEHVSAPSGRKRTEFQRDYDRVIFSSPFRRLQNKTQVFPLPGSVFVHNRLTHSLEVASLGRSLGTALADVLEKRFPDNELVREIPSIVATACLAHDMGNPPFGHSGEDAMSTYFSEKEGLQYKSMFSENEWADLTHFEGNANALRVLGHQYSGRVKGGLRLTYSTLASFIKYPCAAKEGHDKASIHRKKYGYFQADKLLFDKITEELGLIKTGDGACVRHPLVYLVEAADDICYSIIDVEDAHRLGILSYEETYGLLFAFLDKPSSNLVRTLDDLSKDKNEQIAVLRAVAIGSLIGQCSNAFLENEDLILKGEFNKALDTCLSGSVKTAYEKIRDISPKRIYSSRQVVEVELAGYKVLGGLMEEFIPAVLTPEKPFSQKYIDLMPQQFRTDSDIPYDRVMSALDFISGMTDLYAVDLFKKLKGIDLRSI